MAKNALNDHGAAPPAWQHRETRAAILAAARSLGDGPLSLDLIAEKTGFAAPTIYAYFASKADLQVCLVADDVACFARTLCDSFPFSEPAPEEEPTPEPELAPVLSLVPTESAPAATQDEPVSAAEPEPEQSAPVEQSEPEQASEPEMQPADPEPVAASGESGGELADLKQAVTRLEARRVDAWLERRLRVFEKTLADVESRMANAEASSTRALNLTEEGAKSLAQHTGAAEKRQREATDGFSERMEAADRKMRGTLAELRAALNDVYGRLESLEISKGIAVTPTPSLDAQWEAGEISVPTPAAPQEDKPLTAAAETYLSAARRAAKTASDLAEYDSASRFVAAAKKSWLRTRFILAGCVGLGVVLLVIGLVFRHYTAAPKPVRLPPVAIHVAAPVRHITVAKAALAAPAPAHPDMETYRISALASTGNPQAELLLGLRKMDGDAAAQTEAAQLFQKAAAQGDPVAEYWLGTMVERGHGVPADAVAARHLYEASARKGNVKAMYNLAVANAQGRGIKVNPAAAAHWFWVAAMQGYVDAQYNLAVLYERGQGVPQSLVNAYKWYAIAAAAGDQDSKARIDALKTQLGAADLAAGEHAAQSYKPNPQDHAANTAPDPASLPGG
ncbi:MAG TPA: TetR family transcriptional regulator [Rhizomicrobium sp.]|nr:TetR family transcriptional regulator [Rhizomicrobium sp.]